MSFLHPWLLVGAAVLAVPLWLHLRARTGAVTLFPALRFLEDQPRPRARGFRVRDALLLALRLLALLLAVAAFARPAGRGVLVTESRVHVLDNTFSQQAADGFETDRRQLLQELAAEGAGVQSAVVELTGRPRVVAGFGETREEAGARVRALTPSHQRGSYLEALRLAGSLLDQSLGARRVVRVHGDQQQNQWTEHEGSPPFLTGATVELSRVPAVAERPNLSLGETETRYFFLGDATYVDLAVPLHHRGPARSVTAVLNVNGRTVLRQQLALQPPSGTVTLQGQWRADPSQWLSGELLLEDARDALPADDRGYFCLPPVREGRVALLARSPYLRAALDPSVMKVRWAAEVLDPAGAARLLQADERALADVLVVESDYAQAQAVRDLVFRHLNNGRGVVLVLGRATPLLRPFLAELGLTVTGPAVAGPESFRAIATDHPIFRPFAGGALGDLTAARVLRHLPLRAPAATPLVYGDAGDPLLLEAAGTRGRLLAFAFGLDREGSDLPLTPAFVPFVDLLLQHARAGTAALTSALPGALVTHHVEDGPRPREVVLRQGGRVEARAAVDANGDARLTVPDRPGFHTIGYDDGTEPKGMIAVNPSPKESDLRYEARPAALSAWVVPARPEQDARAAVAVAIDDGRLPWLLLLAAAVFLAAESGALLARRAAA
ncbi:MAG: BatA and WFA domain-containing protein [Vicinamibacteria bacterium]